MFGAGRAVVRWCLQEVYRVPVRGIPVVYNSPYRPQRASAGRAVVKGRWQGVAYMCSAQTVDLDHPWIVLRKPWIAL